MENMNRYVLCKSKQSSEIVYLNYSAKDGFKFKPKNEVAYKGIKVNEMVIINQSFIEKVLKRKIKRKLDLYLQFLINLLDSEDEDPTNLRFALNDLDKYKQTIINKYRNYLEKKYIDLLLKKIEVLERELKQKLFFAMKKNMYEQNYEQDYEQERRRGR